MQESRSLSESIARFGLSIENDAAIGVLERYCQLLWQENQQVNLTRHLNYDSFVARDLNDVLQVSRLLQENWEVLDIGSGGGVPGLALAIVRPDLNVHLCESVGKKARILQRMIGQLHLPCRLHHQRAEALLEDERFDAAMARAVGPLWKICRWFQNHWLAMGRLYLFKGAKWQDEIRQASQYPEFRQVDCQQVLDYPMLGTDSQAYILELRAKPTK